MKISGKVYFTGACSWTVEARCFPGTCVGDMILAKDCKCAKGFSGDDCATGIVLKFFRKKINQWSQNR